MANSTGFTITPKVKTLSQALSPLDFFANIIKDKKKEDCLLFESASILPSFGERSIGSTTPCLRIMGKKEKFEITALTESGKFFLTCLKGDLDFCDSVSYSKDKISGILKSRTGSSSKSSEEGDRLKSLNHFEILRKIAFKFTPTSKPFTPYSGLFGFISYDFIDHFEDLPKNKKDMTQDPDYQMYFLDTLFLVDHAKNRTYFVGNELSGPNGNTSSYCDKVLDSYLDKAKAFSSSHQFGGKKESRASMDAKGKTHSFETDMEEKEFISKVKRLQEHIKKGDIYQAVLSRTQSTKTDCKPLDVYRELRVLNPSPYMFFIQSEDRTVLGASPEMSLRVQGVGEKTVEMRPIAGTKPRGLVNGKIDPDLDSRYEAELKSDPKEISEHIMLVDLARNDIAKISKPGSRFVSEAFVVEKYSHVQHLVTNVKGKLKEDLDALHAYIATMNMGTLTGAPKIEAMKLIRTYENTKRGVYGGAIGYLTPSKDMDCAILIRAITMTKGKAFLRAGAGIARESDAQSEFQESQKKMQACVLALEKAARSQ